METSIDFVEKQVVLPAIGPDGMRYLPMLISMFFFIWIGNLFEVIPTSHMPANARMANPLRAGPRRLGACSSASA